MENTLTVSSHITPKIYRDFTLYDFYIRQKRWRQLALFAGILLVSAALCLWKQGYLLTAVLSLIALGLPAANIQNTVKFVNLQSEKSNLSEKPLAYTLTFGPEKIRVQTGDQVTGYRRETVHKVVCRRGGVYLYVQPDKAYLLPADDIPGGPDAVRSYFGGK